MIALGFRNMQSPNYKSQKLYIYLNGSFYIWKQKSITSVFFVEHVMLNGQLLLIPSFLLYLTSSTPTSFSLGPKAKTSKMGKVKVCLAWEAWQRPWHTENRLVHFIKGAENQTGSGCEHSKRSGMVQKLRTWLKGFPEDFLGMINNTKRDGSCASNQTLLPLPNFINYKMAI